MSKLETNTIDTISGSTNLTLGGTNATDITIPSGVTITNNGTQSGFGGTNTPAFSASMSAVQIVSDATATKVQFDTENFDTAGAYDNSSNYRFTVPSGQAGKYFIYSTITGQTDPSRLQTVNAYLYKNGSSIGYSTVDPRNAGFGYFFSCNIARVLDLSVGDYIEIFGFVDPEGSGSYTAKINNTAGSGSDTGATFGAYKIIE